MHTKWTHFAPYEICIPCWPLLTLTEDKVNTLGIDDLLISFQTLTILHCFNSSLKLDYCLSLNHCSCSIKVSVSDWHELSKNCYMVLQIVNWQRDPSYSYHSHHHHNTCMQANMRNIHRMGYIFLSLWGNLYVLQFFWKLFQILIVIIIHTTITGDHHSHSKKWLTLHALTCWHIICLPGDGRCILLTLNFISMIRTAYQRVHPCRPWQLCPPTFMCIIPLMFSKLFMVFSLYRNICCMNLICIMHKVNYCVKNE